MKAIAEACDLLLVIGASNSSNSKRLVEVGSIGGADASILISSADDLNWPIIETAKTLGLSAGASAPEYLTTGVIAALNSRYDMTTKVVEVVKEKVTFRLPRELRDA